VDDINNYGYPKAAAGSTVSFETLTIYQKDRTIATTIINRMAIIKVSQ
jgi:hypothetical protein